MALRLCAALFLSLFQLTLLGQLVTQQVTLGGEFLDNS